MDNREAVNWLINISADIGKAEHSDLWHYEQALTEIKDMLKSAQPELDSEALIHKIGMGITAIDSNDVYSLGMRNGMRWCKSLIDGVEPKFEDYVMGVDDWKELPSAQPERRWIPCSEKLPEEGVKVLITCGGDHVYIAKLRKGISKAERELMKAGKLDDPIIIKWNYIDRMVAVKRSEFIGDCDESFNNKVPYCWDCDQGTWFGQDATAWAPLPEPYQEEGEKQ